ncbi:MAG: hypothetical protein M1354_00830 [Candidatus Marsarchaeota archaeon]|jgi:Zn-dependent oligopeptidase|nr:hypothetical protein [Candidatus Marsarchaeota archaeon]
MAYRETILIKLDSNTKKKMKSVKTNWSELIREFIQRELEKKRNIAKAEKLRAKLFRKSRGIDSTEVIRRMRETRYGPNST